MTLKTKSIAAIILVFFVVGIGGTMALNLWHTRSRRVPAAYRRGEHAGEYNPADIRGSYALADIEKAFGVPAADLAKAFGLTFENEREMAAFMVKGLEAMYGQMKQGELGTDSVRLFVALYKGLPYAAEPDTLLPASAIALLKDRLPEDQIQALRAISVSLSGLIPVETHAEGHTEGRAEGLDYLVRGKTTFADLERWGLSSDEIEQALGMPIGKPGVTVREHISAAGLGFSTVKEALQELVDSKQK